MVFLDRQLGFEHQIKSQEYYSTVEMHSICVHFYVIEEVSDHFTPLPNKEKPFYSSVNNVGMTFLPSLLV